MATPQQQGTRPPVAPNRNQRRRNQRRRQGVDPLFKAPFRTQQERDRAARAYAEEVVGPASEIYEAERRSQEGAENVGRAYTEAGTRLQQSLGAALGALGANTSGMSGANINAGAAAADLLRTGVPLLEGQALVSGRRGEISQKTREAVETRNEKRRQAYADRLNELYKRDVDKATARESSRLTRESLQSKEEIAAADRAQSAYQFNVKTDIAYKKLAQDLLKLKQSGNDDADTILSKAATRMKQLLNATTQGADTTTGFTLRIYDPIKREWVRRWYPGSEQAARDAARKEFGDDLTDNDMQVQGQASTNPDPQSNKYSKYSKQQVRKAMIAWIVSNVPGYTKATAAAWVDSQPEMQLAG